MSGLRVAFHKESWPLAAPFRFAGHTIASSDVVVVTLTDGAFRGRGEATGVIYLGETPDSICAQIAAVAGRLEDGLGRGELAAALPPGGARNAIDCALWDLECKRAGRTIWELLGLKPKPVLTCNTVGLDPVPTARARAVVLGDYPLLKVKVDREDPVRRVAAVRAARPDARIIIDANGAWDRETLAEVAGPLRALGVEMIEQPLPPGADAALADFSSPIPLCADESCLVAADVPALVGLYSLVNIKLDKCGGLTEALRLMQAAETAALGTMVGNMIGTSLSMAPNLVVAQTCLYADLDGPLALVRDRAGGLEYRAGRVSIPQPRLWG
ncbi:MAG TPA: N-acetyl-D-Glu racemase DgcA [Caulobacteraceae bacterium]|jgi:L-alanine-DL-glutamate epimerase-like enolase superfamily enzyme|nr:N-acetyl-D-Glu racemase DgcA [Caulobacteraceae bacterium]